MSELKTDDVQRVQSSVPIVGASVVIDGRQTEAANQLAHGELVKSYIGVRNLFRRYWRVYGGGREFLRSPYLHISGAIAALSYEAWARPDWWDRVFSVLPNLVGFSIGAFAIFLGVGGEVFQRKIAGTDPDAPAKSSPFMRAAASFTHFIVVQAAAIIMAVILSNLYLINIAGQPALLIRLNDWARHLAWFVGGWLFIYALVLTFSTVMVIFRTAGWLDDWYTEERKKK